MIMIIVDSVIDGKAGGGVIVEDEVVTDAVTAWPQTDLGIISKLSVLST